MKILVVDDAPEVVESVTVGLSLHWREVDVLGAADGKSALDFVERESPDLVLLDVGLPDIDGYKVLEAPQPPLRARHPEPKPQIRQLPVDPVPERHAVLAHHARPALDAALDSPLLALAHLPMYPHVQPRRRVPAPLHQRQRPPQPRLRPPDQLVPDLHAAIRSFVLLSCADSPLVAK